jgi:hypothetical protein
MFYGEEFKLLNEDLENILNKSIPFFCSLIKSDLLIKNLHQTKRQSSTRLERVCLCVYRSSSQVSLSLSDEEDNLTSTRYTCETNNNNEIKDIVNNNKQDTLHKVSK